MARDVPDAPAVLGLPDGADVLPPRPTAFDEALAAEIVETVSLSPRSMMWLVATHPHWPTVSVISGWKVKHPDFRNAFHEARRRLADELAFQAIEIADDASGDRRDIERRDGSIFTVLDQEFVARSKLRVETRQWMAKKLAPEVYGDRQDITLRPGAILSQEEALEQLR